MNELPSGTMTLHARAAVVAARSSDRADPACELITSDEPGEHHVLSRRALVRGVVVSLVTIGVVGMGGVGVVFDARPPIGKKFRVSFLVVGVDEPMARHNMAATQRALRDLGYLDDQIVYEGRDTQGDLSRMPIGAAEAVAWKPDLILCWHPHAAIALKAATQTIPVVFVLSVDPVDWGLVASLARPGGNLTGLSYDSEHNYTKELELLKESVPTISRVAILLDNVEPPQALAQAQVAARLLNVEIVAIGVRTRAETETTAALEAAAAARADALWLTPAANFVVGAEGVKRCADFASRRGWPSILPTTAGGLIGYGSREPVDPWSRVAHYVHRIFGGAKPADLPVEGPAGSLLRINLCAAASLGVTVPRAVLARADEVLCAQR